MSKIYLPTEFLNKPCYVINNDYIRVYNTINSNYQNTIYDIYFKSDYIVRVSTAGYSTSTQCDHFNTYTDDITYRYDFDKTLICFLILAIMIVYFPLRLFFKFFRRFKI